MLVELPAAQAQSALLPAKVAVNGGNVNGICEAFGGWHRLDETHSNGRNGGRGAKGPECSEIAPDSSGFDRAKPVLRGHHPTVEEILMDSLCLVCL